MWYSKIYAYSVICDSWQTPPWFPEFEEISGQINTRAAIGGLIILHPSPLLRTAKLQIYNLHANYTNVPTSPLC